jgi:hypothetical protein
MSEIRLYYFENIKTTTGYNSTLAIGGVSCSKDSFVVNQTLVLRINPDSYRDAEKPAHTQAANRYSQYKLKIR